MWWKFSWLVIHATLLNKSCVEHWQATYSNKLFKLILLSVLHVFIYMLSVIAWSWHMSKGATFCNSYKVFWLVQCKSGFTTDVSYGRFRFCDINCGSRCATWFPAIANCYRYLRWFHQTPYVFTCYVSLQSFKTCFLMSLINVIRLLGCTTFL